MLFKNEFLELGKSIKWYFTHFFIVYNAQVITQCASKNSDYKIRNNDIRTIIIGAM